MKLSIIIPVYNEERTITAVLDRVCRSDVGDLDQEIIIANDGSTDGTRRAIEASPWRADARVRVYEASSISERARHPSGAGLRDR